MSQYHQTGRTVLWNPSNGASEVFLLAWRSMGGGWPERVREPAQRLEPATPR